MGYLILYSSISYHETVSRGVTLDPLERYGLGNYWYYLMVWEISGICRGIITGRSLERVLIGSTRD